MNASFKYLPTVFSIEIDLKPICAVVGPEQKKHMCFNDGQSFSLMATFPSGLRISPTNENGVC